MIIREFRVAVCSKTDASSISAIKVDIPFCPASPAPTRARILSTTDMSALEHGTKLPTWAIITILPIPLI